MFLRFPFLTIIATAVFAAAQDDAGFGLGCYNPALRRCSCGPDECRKDLCEAKSFFWIEPAPDADPNQPSGGCGVATRCAGNQYCPLVDPTPAPVAPTRAPINPTRAPVSSDAPTDSPDDPVTNSPTRIIINPTRAPVRTPTPTTAGGCYAGGRCTGGYCCDCEVSEEACREQGKLYYSDCGTVGQCYKPGNPTVPPDPTPAPVNPTQAPDPTPTPVEPTDAPVEPTDAPVEPTNAPVESTNAPVAPPTSDCVDTTYNFRNKNPRNCDEIRAKSEQTQKKQCKKKKVQENCPVLCNLCDDGLIFRVVSQESDLLFLPALLGPPEQGVSIQGSQFIQNGDVYNKNEVEVNNGQIGNYPAPTPGSFYNQQCTAMKGTLSEGNPRVLQNICHFNLCLANRGCLFLRTGGAFNFDPFAQSVDAVPDAKGIVIGGTQDFDSTTGQVKIKTISVSANNSGRESVLQIEIEEDD